MQKPGVTARLGAAIGAVGIGVAIVSGAPLASAEPSDSDPSSSASDASPAPGSEPSAATAGDVPKDVASDGPDDARQPNDRPTSTVSAQTNTSTPSDEDEDADDSEPDTKDSASQRDSKNTSPEQTDDEPPTTKRRAIVTTTPESSAAIEEPETSEAPPPAVSQSAAVVERAAETQSAMEVARAVPPAQNPVKAAVTATLSALSGLLSGLNLPSGIGVNDPVLPAPLQLVLGGLDVLRRQLDDAVASPTPVLSLVRSISETFLGVNPVLRTTTKGIDVYNLTDKPLTLVAYGSAERALNGPAIGTVIPSGGVLRFEVIYNFLRRTTVKPVFEAKPADPGATTYAMELITTEFNEAAVRCSTSGGSGQCFAGGAKYILGNNVTMVGAAGSEIVIDATDVATQSRFLNNLCNEEARTSCSFTPVREDRNAYEPSRQVSYEANDSQNPVTRSISISDTQTQTDSVNVTAKISRSFLDKIVNLEISVAYGHTWTGSHTFTRTYTTTIPPGYASAVDAENPVLRVYGDFRMLLPGDTKVLITNTTWDTPDATRTVKYRFYDIPLQPTV